MTALMRTSDFDYFLPPELIAQAPAAARDMSRLLVLDRSEKRVSHRTFPALREYLRPGDVVVLNNSRVIPARLRATNSRTNGKFEVLLLEQVSKNNWWAMMRPGKRARLGTKLEILDAQMNPTGVLATVAEINSEGHRRVEFSGAGNILDELDRLGEIPLPPYIERAVQLPEDRERYQTVYAKAAGSVAAPTAGLHFTEQLLENIRAQGVQICFVTLHVGLGTFAPVKAQTVGEHIMHEEQFELSAETAAIITHAKARPGSRVFAVGTTTVRVLETVARNNGGKVVKESGRTNIFIYPPFHFQAVDAMVTNFHLPCSTLMMLVSAFASPDKLRGRELILNAYDQAVREHYRFFSYGDAMLIL